MNNYQEEIGLDNESYNKFKLFNRILISYNDFKQAHEITRLLIDQNLYQNYPRENRILVISLNMAAIVACARPFINSQGGLAHNRLPDKVLKILSKEEITVHEIVLRDRNTVMAHSDADANLSTPVVMEIENRSLLIPMNASPYAAPLLPKVIQALSDMTFKLQEYCFEMRMKMEPEMIPILKKVQNELT